MMEGIVDNFKLIGSMAFKSGYMPESDEEGNIIQSKKQASQYKKRFLEHVKNGEILRFWAHNQISNLNCYHGLDEVINKRRQEEVERLNINYYGKDKYLKIKQCMEG